MPDFERDLGDELRRRVEGYTPSPDLPGRIRARTRQRQRRRQALAGGAVAAVLAVAVGLPLALRDGGEDEFETATVSQEVATTVAAAPTAAGGARTAADTAGEAEGAADVAEAPAGAVATTAVAVASAGLSELAGEALVVALDDGRVVLVDAGTGAETGTVVADTSGAVPSFDESGTAVYVAPGCGSTATRYSLDDGARTSDPAWRDAVAVAESGSLSAVVTPTTCTGATDEYVLTLFDAGAEVRRVPVGAVSSLRFDPDGRWLAWLDNGVPTVLDGRSSAADRASSPLPAGCIARDLTFSGVELIVAAACEGRAGSSVFTATPGPAPAVLDAELPGIDVVDISVGPAGQLAVVDDTGTLWVVEPGGAPRALRSGVLAAGYSES